MYISKLPTQHMIGSASPAVIAVYLPVSICAQSGMKQDLVLNCECTHNDYKRGVGASHQTGWTALVANCFLPGGQTLGRLQS